MAQKESPQCIVDIGAVVHLRDYRVVGTKIHLYCFTNDLAACAVA